jgi:hypothetical protein
MLQFYLLPAQRDLEALDAAYLRHGVHSLASGRDILRSLCAGGAQSWTTCRRAYLICDKRRSPHSIILLD